MSRFIINGRKELTGTFRPAGNKNAVLPMLAASLLTDEPVVLKNAPQIMDVRVMLDLLSSLGVTVSQRGHSITLCASSVRHGRPAADLCRRVRASILLAGPLAARHGRAVLPPPGGDVIGRRRLDTHRFGLGLLGIRMDGIKELAFKRAALRGADILLDEASVTATENILMAATIAKGRTVIRNAACEPHVQDLGRLLIRMGARIDGLGSNRIVVHGVSRLHGATHTVQPDHIEVGSFLAAAAATHGSLRVQASLDEEAFEVMQRTFVRLGIHLVRDRDGLTLARNQKCRVQEDLGRTIPKIEDGVWPAFPSDLMSVLIVLATQVKGAVLFFEKLFESRLYFVDRLIEMGAHIIQCDPHRVVVAGPSRLHGTHLSTPDIRAGMALVVAALCAKGRSIIENAEVVDRGYENIESRLQALGADIVREI